MKKIALLTLCCLSALSPQLSAKVDRTRHDPRTTNEDVILHALSLIHI